MVCYIPRTAEKGLLRYFHDLCSRPSTLCLKILSRKRVQINTTTAATGVYTGTQCNLSIYTHKDTTNGKLTKHGTGDRTRYLLDTNRSHPLIRYGFTKRYYSGANLLSVRYASVERIRYAGSSVYAVKNKVLPRTGHEGPEGEQRYNYTLSLTSALDGGWVVNATPRPLYPRERRGTPCTGGWVGPRAGLDGCRKSRPTGVRSPDRAACSESLYRLSYPGPR